MKPQDHSMAANRPAPSEKRYNGNKKYDMTDETTNNDGSENSTENDQQRLYAAPIGPTTYTVLSRGNAGRNAYNVDVAQLTCTCEDFQYNVSGDEDRNVCKHLEKAISKHPHPDAYYSFQGGRVQRVDVTQSAKDKETAEAVEETEAAITESPEDAHDRLKTSLADTDIAFKTELQGSRIWFAFDEYVNDKDYPEFDHGPFAYYFLEPGMVEYDPDSRPDFKNYLAPGDVDAYISEVLQ